MVSTILAEISRRDLQDITIPSSASITDVKHLSSYNWVDEVTPTIAVPGSPALWSAPTAPTRVKKDSGLIYIAQNAARHPDSPLEPLFRALYITHPSFDIRPVDIVTDRNNIRKLLSFVNPSSSRNGLETFTINVEVANNTAIFCRDETKTHEVIAPYEFKGHGHEFERAYTKGQISKSTGHHRILSYRFGDLNFIIRHETDGYVEIEPKQPASNSKEAHDDSLSNLLDSLTLSPTQDAPYSKPSGSKLTVIEDGQVVPLESTLEIKTRVMHRPLEIYEIASQLWISQTPKLVRAYHQKGIFQKPAVEDVVATIKTWEEHNQMDLKKLAALISKILEVLVIRESDKGKILPQDLYSKWDDEASPKAETNLGQEIDTECPDKPADGVGTKTELEKESIEPTAEDAPDKKATEGEKEGEQTLPSGLSSEFTVSGPSFSGSKTKEGEDLAADSVVAPGHPS